MFLQCQIPHLPECQFTLSQTFRYGHQQALAAQQLIHQNIFRHPLLTVSHGLQHTSIDLERHETPVYQLALLLEKLQNKAPSQNVAVIAPTWVALEPVQMALILKKIPYAIKTEKRLNMHDGFQLIQALALLNRSDYDNLDAGKRAEAIKTVLTTPYHPVKMELITSIADQLGQLPRQRVLHHISELQQSAQQPLWLTLENLNIALTQLKSHLNSAEEVLSHYYQQTDLIEKIQQDALLSEERRNDKCFHYQQLVILAQKKAQPFAEFAAFIEGVFKLTHVVKQSNIVLGTVHFHKGLEYDHVFVMAGESWGNQPTSLDEDERRSLYVAITRAKISTTILCHSTSKLSEIMQLDFAQQAYAKLMGKSLISKLSYTCNDYLNKLMAIVQK
jgi:superfamily I DNA/RNA helicase